MTHGPCPERRRCGPASASSAAARRDHPGTRAVVATRRRAARERRARTADPHTGSVPRIVHRPSVRRARHSPALLRRVDEPLERMVPTARCLRLRGAGLGAAQRLAFRSERPGALLRPRAGRVRPRARSPTSSAQWRDRFLGQRPCSRPRCSPPPCSVSARPCGSARSTGPISAGAQCSRPASCQRGQCPAGRFARRRRRRRYPLGESLPRGRSDRRRRDRRHRERSPAPGVARRSSFGHRQCARPRRSVLHRPPARPRRRERRPGAAFADRGAPHHAVRRSQCRCGPGNRPAHTPSLLGAITLTEATARERRIPRFGITFNLLDDPSRADLDVLEHLDAVDPAGSDEVPADPLPTSERILKLEIRSEALPNPDSRVTGLAARHARHAACQPALGADRAGLDGTERGPLDPRGRAGSPRARPIGDGRPSAATSRVAPTTSARRECTRIPGRVSSTRTARCTASPACTSQEAPCSRRQATRTRRSRSSPWRCGSPITWSRSRRPVPRPNVPRRGRRGARVPRAFLSARDGERRGCHGGTPVVTADHDERRPCSRLGHVRLGRRCPSHRFRLSRCRTARVR